MFFFFIFFLNFLLKGRYQRLFTKFMYKVTSAGMKRAYDAYGHECIFTMIVNVGGTVRLFV